MIGEESFTFHRKAAAIAAEAALDGIYVVRTSLPKKALDAAATVGAYKSLARVERAFRSLKTVDIQILGVAVLSPMCSPYRKVWLKKVPNALGATLDFCAKK